MRSSLALPLLWAIASVAPLAATAADIDAVEHSRTTIYHSPQTPGYTCWVGAWAMPDGDLMVAFTQATGPVEGRPKAPQPIRDRLNWPPGGPEYENYDMTGLDLRNVHLRSSDGGTTWRQVSADPIRTCMNGVSGETETALPDGTIVRGVNGFQVAYFPEWPLNGFLQRSSDGTRSWSRPELFLEPDTLTWPRRMRVLRDGRLVVLLGIVRIPPAGLTRNDFSREVVPLLLVSSDGGRHWDAPIEAATADQRTGWTEEFDIAELDNGDLLCVFRRSSDAHRWQSVLEKNGDRWKATPATVSVLPHSGQPELLATREGPILHIATSGIHATSDAGATWTQLSIPGSAYYPRSVQVADGEVYVFGHIGSDDAYGKVDQSVVMDRFVLREGQRDKGAEGQRD